MPLTLKDPQTYKIDTVRITGFNVNVDPRSVAIHYARGYVLGEKFVAVETATTAFDGPDPSVDDKLYSSVKAALYEMLQRRVGAGSVSAAVSAKAKTAKKAT